jgi:flagellar motility protein MotE (MotC chaperone)
MKKILRSTWFIAVLALLLGLGTQAAVLGLRLSKLEQAPPPVVVKPDEVPDTIAFGFTAPEIQLMQEELKGRLASVAVREKELDDYDLRLRAERAEIEKLKRDVEKMRTDLAETVTEVQVVEQKNLKTLAATYTSIAPSAALAIFREMDDEMVVKILSFMKPDPVGQILEEMARPTEGRVSNAGRAATISNKLRLLRQVRAEENS